MNKFDIDPGTIKIGKKFYSSDFSLDYMLGSYRKGVLANTLLVQFRRITGRKVRYE